MKDEILISKEELTNLNERVKKLAIEKSYLQLFTNLMGKMSAVSGLQNTIQNLLQIILENIGGSNIIIYYMIDDEIYYADVLGETKRIDRIEDEFVKKVFETKTVIEYQSDFSDTKLLTSEFTKANIWAFPLMIGVDLIAVIKIENLYIGASDLRFHMPTFFSYAAHILKNEIQSQTKLKAAFDQLSEENNLRKHAEEELRTINEELENRVEERTIELHHVNVLLEEELAERQRAEQQLRLQYTLLSALINSPGDIIIFSLDNNYCYTAFNEQHRTEMKIVWNVDIEMGTNLLECMSIPKLRELAKQSMDRALKGEAFNEIQHQPEPDTYYEFNWNPIFQNKEVVGITAFIQNISERKHAEAQIIKLNRIYAVLSNINQSIVRIHDTKVLFDEVCRIAVEYGKFRMVWIGLVNPTTNKVEVGASNGFTGDYLEKINIDLNDALLSSGPTGQAIKSGKRKISNNIETDETMIPWQKDAIKYGYKSSASFPLIVFNEVVGALSIYADEINYFEQEDINLFVEMALDISFALEFMETESKRRQVEKELSESEEKFRRLTENARDVIYRMSLPDGKYEYVSPATLSMLGYSPEEYYENPMLFRNSVHPDWHKYFEEQWTNLLKGEMPPFYEYQIIHKSEEVRWLNQRNILVRDDTGNPIAIEAIATDVTESKCNEAINTSRLSLLQFAATHSLDELLEETLNQAEILTGSLIGFYHFVEEDQKTLTLQNWSTRTKAEFCKAEGKGLHYSIDDAGVWVECVYQRKTVIHNDYASLSNRKGMPEGHAEVIRELVVPVLRGEKIKAILGVGNKPSDYNEKDVEAISILADLAWEIAERKRAEEAVLKREAQLNEAQRIAQIGSWELNIVNNVLVWSDEIYRIFEIDAEKFGASYEAFLNAIHPDDREAVNTAYTNSLKTHAPYAIDHRLRFENGRIKYVHEQCETIYDEQDIPLRSFGTVQDITERKQAEESLRESETRLRVMFENSRDAIGVSKKGIHIFANPAYLKLFGYENLEKIVGTQILDCIAPSHHQQIIENVKLRIAGEHVPNFYETRGRRIDGSEFDFEINVSTYELNSEIYTLANIRDITQRKLLEKALFFVAQRGWQTGEENFFDALAQFLGENLNMDYVIIDKIDENPEIAETIALYAKGAIVPNMRYELKGTPCENVMGRQLCFYPQDVQKLFPEDNLLVEMGVECYIGIPLWDSSGRPIGLIALMSCKPLPDDTPATQLLQLVATRAAAELERERSDLNLRAREREFRTLAENIPDHIIRYDVNCRGIYLNHVDESTKYSNSSLVGKPPTDTEFNGVKGIEEYDEKLHRVIETGTEEEMEMVLPDLEGNVHVHEVHFVAERDNEGKIVGALAIGRDITERKSAEEKLNKQLEELQRWHNVTLGREDRIQELKKEVNELLARYGQSLRYSKSETGK